MKKYNVVKKASELQLGDVIRVSDYDGPYMTATVIKITPSADKTRREITVFRPYVHTSDVETTVGIIPYTGFEQFEFSDSTDREYLCYETDVGIK